MACISNKGCLITLNSVCKIYQLYSSYCFYGEIVGDRAELAKFESKSYHEIMPKLYSNQVCIDVHSLIKKNVILKGVMA